MFASSSLTSTLPNKNLSHEYLREKSAQVLFVCKNLIQNYNGKKIKKQWFWNLYIILDRDAICQSWRIKFNYFVIFHVIFDC